jgi:predicted RND superfamily exporter protein
MFWIGLASGIFESLGKTCIATAVTIGLAGPASAITSLSGVELVIINILRFHKMISLVETFAIVLSLIGSIFLVVPGFFNMLFGRKSDKEFNKIEAAD